MEFPKLNVERNKRDRLHENLEFEIASLISEFEIKNEIQLDTSEINLVLSSLISRKAKIVINQIFGYKVVG